MSTDRELLEMAAKAAGLAIDKSETNGGGRGNTGFDMSGNAVLDWYSDQIWNPLRDDGDALRLAVKLGIEVRRPSKARSIGSVVQVWFPADGNPSRAASSTTSCAVRGCVLTETRRAIVLAAAEIGRSMP